MATTSAPSHRASLLAGLRTGGVRSASGPMGNIPHSAAPGASFSVPRYASAMNNERMYFQEEEDELADMVNHNMYIKQNINHQQAMTAAVDGSANRFAQQQSYMNGMPMSPFVVNNANSQAQFQALQLQMMQVEIARLQNLQAQQYQADLIAQAQRQRSQPQQSARRPSATFVPPATAGPTNSSFDLRASAMNSQLRRSHQAEQLRARLGVVSEDQVPMTATLGGKFGSRIVSSSYETDEEDLPTARNVPGTPNHTTIISGGTSLGGGAITPSKSDAAVSWRRSSPVNSALNASRNASAPVVKITPPPSERITPPPSGVSPIKTRPQPLRFAAAEPLPNVAIVTNDSIDGDDSSSVSSKSDSSPTTPRTASSSGDLMPPLSPREEATKKLYEGLGIGRPIPTVTVVAPPPAPMPRFVSHVMRQPRGPPSNNEELIPKNFATRSRRKAIGALGALLDAREKREFVVEAY